MTSRCLRTCLATAAALALSGLVSAQEDPLKGHSPDEVNKRRQKQISDAAPDKARVRPKKPRRVLVWMTPAHLMKKDPHKGYCTPLGSFAMKTLGEKTGAYESVLSNDQVMLLPESLAKFDAIILNNATSTWISPSDDALAKIRTQTGNAGLSKEAAEEMLKKGLLDYVRNGRGIMGYHFAIGGNRKWAEFHEMLGASFWGHPWNEEVGVKVDDPDHPLVADFEGKGFRIKEETFQYNDPYSRKKLRVLLSLDTETTNMGVKWIHRTDNDFALAWVRSYGKGRVFYTAFGHRSNIYMDPRIMQLYLDGIQFVLGDLDAPTEPSDPN